MKRNRVIVTLLVVVALLAAFFFMPLPIFSRVREVGMVQLPPDAIEKVHLPNLPAPGLILERLDVYDGQRVSKGHVLAQFRSIDVENELAGARSALESYEVQLRSLREQKDQTFDPHERGKIETQLAQVQGSLAAARAQFRVWDEAQKSLEIRAPRDGIVMSCPKKDAVGRQWDKEKSEPFCSIGDPSKLQVLLPVPPADHRLLRDEIEQARTRNRDLLATIRVQGFAGKTWEGRVDQLQESEARDVPPQLTTKFGGPLAVRQTAHGGMTPQSQHYLVTVDFIHPDGTIHPGTLGRVKIHTRWRSCWWWVYRSISSTFNLGLI